MKQYLAFLFCAPVLFGWSTVQAAEPAFDCAKSTHEVEELICSDESLAALDRELDAVYHKAMKRLPAEDKKYQKAFQRGWIKGRNDCWKSADPKACAEFRYKSRIAELQIISGQLVAPRPEEYRCDGGRYDSLTAVFYDKAKIPTAVFTRINGSLDEQDIAYLQQFEGRKQYVGNKAILRRGGEGLFGKWNNKPVACRRL